MANRDDMEFQKFDEEGAVRTSEDSKILRLIYEKLPITPLNYNGELLVRLGGVGTSYVYSYGHYTLNTNSPVMMFENPQRTSLNEIAMRGLISYV